MHALTRWLQAEMDRRGWSEPAAYHACGIDRRTWGPLFNPERDRLGGVLSEATVEKLARGFEVDESLIWRLVARSLVPPTVDWGLMPDLEEIHRRLDRIEGGGSQPGNGRETRP